MTMERVRTVTSHPLPNDESAFSQRDFRNAMGSFATGICIVAANTTDGKAVGMTVNSFSSLSLDPPLVLFCLGVESTRSQAIIQAGKFNISMLGANQVEISNHFAKPGEGLALDGMVASGENGAPVVPHALAVIECDLDAQHVGGDHIIMVGRATRVSVAPERDPLLYFHGSYRHIGDEI